MKNAKVSTALLPVMKLPGMRCYASQLVLAGADALRAAAVDVLLKMPQKIQGVSLVVCVHSQGGRVSRFAASFAAFGLDNRVWTGDTARPRLSEIVEHVEACMRQIRSVTADEPLDRVYTPALP